MEELRTKYPTLASCQKRMDEFDDVTVHSDDPEIQVYRFMKNELCDLWCLRELLAKEERQRKLASFPAWLTSHGVDSSRVRITAINYADWEHVGENGKISLEFDGVKSYISFDVKRFGIVKWEIGEFPKLDEIHLKTIKAIQEDYKSLFNL